MPTVMTDPEQAVQFLSALFDPGDVILFRPIETWTAGGRKQSASDYKGTRWHQVGVRDAAGNWCATPNVLKDEVARLIKRAESTRCNIFFGACPRVGPKQFDKAWQIRTVRALWCDVDDTADVNVLQERVITGQVPDPSIVVASGHGLQVWWRLKDAITIDAGDPPPIHTRFVKDAEGKPKPHQYIVDPETGEHLAIDARQNVPELHPTAILIGDYLSGIAAALHGDHVTDLSRPMRLPGTLNRKGERMGVPPVPSTVLQLCPDRRYVLDDFAHLAERSHDRIKREAIAKIKLPAARKLSDGRRATLTDLANRCAVAPVGSRSEADWALVCKAVEQGWPVEEVWVAVENIGKFAERGRKYFDQAFEKAQLHTRESIYARIEIKLNAAQKAKPEDATTATGVGGGAARDAEDEDAATIVISPDDQPVGCVLERITDQMIRAGWLFSRSETPVAIRGDKILAIDDAARLAGVIASVAEVKIVGERSERYDVLPVRYGSAWLNHFFEPDRLPVVNLYTRNPVYVQMKLVPPGFDPDSGVYYAGPPVTPRDDRTHLDTLLREFCWQAPADRSNFVSILLTCLLMPRFKNSKPAVVFSANQPGLGKTLLAQIIGILRDGRPAETITFNPNDEELEKTLGARIIEGATTVIIDNAKTGRTGVISSPAFERAITDETLCFRRLGSSSSIRVENSHIFAITANSPNISRDLISRSVAVRLYFEGNPSRRDFEISPEDYAVANRVAILGELAGYIERWKAAGMPLGKYRHRFMARGWPRVIGGILDVAGEPDFLANVEEAAAEYDRQAIEVVELIAHMASLRDYEWKAAEIVEVAEDAKLLVRELTGGAASASMRAKVIRMGLILSRYIGERFWINDETTVLLVCRSECNSKRYYLETMDVGGENP